MNYFLEWISSYKILQYDQYYGYSDIPHGSTSIHLAHTFSQKTCILKINQLQTLLGFQLKK